ncbi:cytochrome c3 family protein [Paracidobacterium acidisoli]|uniref:cytochrome c3 family protein n=1 Tax=Paracidobacterium acidisoli TaxID=2303751 RepID=UPI001314BA7A|nr:cytochrome c family protein [Paracidobacterium acidisoli]
MQAVKWWKQTLATAAILAAAVGAEQVRPVMAMPAAQSSSQAQSSSPPAASAGTQTPAPADASAKQQPFPFSHKRHAALKINCTYCHTGAETGVHADFPVQSKCMACHAQVDKDAEPIKQLAALPPDTHITPEKPVYTLPDFVTFSHARHKAAGAACAACHGDVWASDVVQPHLPMRMKACIDCHRENHAQVTCTTCHEAFQQ